MANKLVEELIIKVKQQGAKQVAGDLKNLNKEVDKAKKNSDIEINITMPKAIVSSLSKMEQHLEKMAREAEFAGQSLGELELNTQELVHTQSKFATQNIKTTKSIENMTRAGNSQARSMSAMAKMAGPLPLIYANIAANVFAVSEAFRLITEGEQLARLEQVGVTLGKSMGAPIQSIAQNMQELTGYTVSYGDALRQATAASSYGFDSQQIEVMTMAARRASVALGVDMQDALNRVIKGVSKLEPELLDELGITTKLNEAYKNYAKQVDVSVDSLTSYQQRAALINEIQSQSVNKLGELDNLLKDGSGWEAFGAAMSSSFQNFFKNISQSTQGMASFLSKVDTLQERAVKIRESGSLFSGTLAAADTREAKAAAVVAAQTQIDALTQAMKEAQAKLDAPGFLTLGTKAALKDTVAWAKGSIKLIQEEIGKIDLGVPDVKATDEAYKNLKATVLGSTAAYSALRDNITGQSSSYEALARNTKEMAKSYDLLKAKDPSFDSAEALKRLGVESEFELRSLVKLTDQYAKVNRELDNFVALSAKTTYKEQVGGRDPNETKLVLLKEQLRIQEALTASEIKLGVAPAKRAANEAKVYQLKKEILDTEIDIKNQEFDRYATQVQLQAGLQPDLITKQQILAIERSRLATLQSMVGTDALREQSLTKVKQLENEILAAQTAQSNSLMQSALGNLSSFAPGIDQMTSSLNALAMSFNNMGQSSMTATQMVSSGLNAFQGMLAYASNDAISTINAQIAAEQKRDGKSKESVAKIAALEKKKVEQQKKVAKQQILISTAVAVMNAAANPWPMPAIPLMATAALAGGLAYQQASSASSNLMASAGESTKASLTIGSRSNQVDVSQSASRGELGYIRNESGVGSLQSFTPRANGGVGIPGNSIVVGEHGPEIITPLEPVRAYSAEESRGMGKGGSTTNITLKIDAIDAKSIMDRSSDITNALVDELYQRGYNINKLY